MNLIFFTQSYPCGGVTEKAFVEPELALLAQRFDTVTIVPQKIEDAQADHFERFGGNISVDTSWATIHRPKITITAALRALFNSGEDTLANVLRPKKLRATIKHLALLETFQKWLGERGRDFGNTLFYSFWLCEEAEALGLMAVKDPRVKVVARAHRFDLYEFPGTLRSKVWRRRALKGITAIYPCSEDGSRYLRLRYPGESEKITTSYLGIPAPRTLPDHSAEEQSVRLLSCSNLVANKRVPLIARTVVALADLMKDYQFSWTHIGDGPEREAVEAVLSESACANLQVNLVGRINHDRVVEILETHDFDLGIHLSESEGLPFAIMEMMSYGIPVVACDAGGVRECVTNENGGLLSINVTPDMVCACLGELLKDGNKLQGKRQDAQQTFKDRFDAEKCRREFVSELERLRQ